MLNASEFYFKQPEKPLTSRQGGRTFNVLTETVPVGTLELTKRQAKAAEMNKIERLFKLRPLGGGINSMPLYIAIAVVAEGYLPINLGKTKDLYSVVGLRSINTLEANEWSRQ